MRSWSVPLVVCLLLVGCDNATPTATPAAEGPAAPLEAPPPPPTPQPAAISDLSTFPTTTGIAASGVDGNADVAKLGEMFQLSDSNAAEHRYAVWRFSGATPATKYEASLTVERPESDKAGALLRLAEVTESGERLADCAFQPATGETATRDAAKPEDVSVEIGQHSLTVRCRITTGDAPKGLAVYLLPAVGPNMTSYSETGVSMLTVRALQVDAVQ